MVRNILLIICLLNTGWSYAQLIANDDCTAFTEEPFFDADFIKKNKIKSINGEIKTKGNLQVIKDSKLVSKYEFDENGQLKIQLGSFNSVGSNDTTFISYFYDADDNLITKRTNDTYGFYSYNYTYNKKGEKVSKTYCREENSGKDRYNFQLGKQYVIVGETYSYDHKDSIVVQSIYNNHKRVFQKIKTKFNEFGLKEYEENQFLISKKKSGTYYKYTDNGEVAEKKHYKNVKSKDDYELWKYEYDEFGNLTFIDYYKGVEHVKHQEVLYNKANYMLKALLVQDVASNFITIIKFTTEFYL